MNLRVVLPPVLSSTDGSEEPYFTSTHTMMKAARQPRRLLFAHTEPGGLGHRVSALIFAHLAAAELGAELKVPVDFWAASYLAASKSYMWFAELMNLPLEDAPEGTPIVHKKEDILNVLDTQKESLSAAVIMAGHAAFCNGSYCANNAWTGAYRTAWPWMRAAVNFTKFPSPYQATSQFVHCAWHVRIGDIVLSSSLAMIALFDNMIMKMGNVAVEFFILSANPLCEGTNAFCDFELHLKQRAFRVHFLQNLSDYDTMRYMTWCDVLVSTGSSFPYAAAVIGSPELQLVISMPAKETNGLNVYDRGDFLRVSSHGSFDGIDSATRIKAWLVRLSASRGGDKALWRLDWKFDETLVDSGNATMVDGFNTCVRLDLLSACGCEGCVLYDIKAAQVFNVRDSVPSCIVVEGLGGGTWLNYVSTEFGEILRLLQELPGYIPMQPRPKIETVLDWLAGHCPGGGAPDAVVFWESGTLGLDADDFAHSHQWQEARKSSLICVFMDDLHYFTEEQAKMKVVAMERAHHIFATYAYKISSWYPSIDSEKVTWMPHSAGRHFLRDSMNTSAEDSLLISGAIGEQYYPCRVAAREAINQGDKLLKMLEHPGYDSSRKFPPKHYPETLMQHKLALATTMRIGYMVAKVFEIPAVGTAVLINNDMQDLLSDLGMHPNVHYVPFFCSMASPPSSNLSHVARQILGESERLTSIRRHGMDLMRAKHTVMHRAWQLHAVTHSQIELFRRKSLNYQPQGTLSRFPTLRLRKVGQCFGYKPQRDDWPDFLHRYAHNVTNTL